MAAPSQPIFTFHASRWTRAIETAKAAPGLVIDFNRRGKPIGIEITAPTKLSAAALNRVLRRLGFPLVTRADLAPLRAA